ncbi:alpha/beta fold hydrolase [Specibacter sp. NPDC078692]|uniref:alpha/beta fold hydrolase n=1 Tax=Specibacter sp. NPDC078692 TaxID=3155818 RepID=UPI00342F09C4
MTAAVHVGGAGENIVLLHGLGARWQIFTPIIASLEQHHRVHAFDLPGFGVQPSDPSLRPGTAGLADWVSAELQTRGILSPHIVGSSMGAGIALELAHRGIAGRVTAFAPIGFWNAAERRWCVGILSVLRTAAQALPRPLRAALRTRAGRALLLFPLFGRPAHVDPQAAIADLAALASCDGFGPARAAFATQRAVPAADGVPTTIVWGRRDMVLPARSQSLRARRVWGRAHHVLLDGCGHLPFSDDPERCVALILEQLPSAKGNPPLDKDTR